MRDHGLALFFEQVNELPLLCDQFINFRGFAIEECGDRSLFGEGGES